MPGLRDLLDRFRPAGAPGAATAAGVPADRRAGVEAELEPVLAALADVERECADLRLVSADEALRCGREADEQAVALTARARASVAAERAAAAAVLRDRAAVDLAEIGVNAADAADAVRRNADARMADLVGRAVARVRADVAAFCADGLGRSGAG